MDQSESVMWTPELAIAAAVVVVIGVTQYLIYRWRNPKCNGVLPPGSMGFPLIGETIQFLSPGHTLDLLPFIKKRVHKYGPIFRTSLVGRPIVVTADPEINSFIYSQEGKTVELWYLDSISKVFKQDGEARTTAGGGVHKYLRTITLNHFGSESIKAKLLADIQRYVNKVIGHWSSQPSVEVQRQIMAMLYDFNAGILFGYDPEKSNEKISESLITLAYGFMAIPLNIPGTQYNKCLKAQKKLVNTFKALVKERRQASVATVAARGDFLDQALRDIEIEQFLTEEFVVNLLFGISFASGSISTSLILMFKLLAENPSVLEELTAEHNEFLKQRKDPESPITWEEYKSMKFTLQVIYETLRLTNAMPFLLRRTIKDLNIKGYTIPAGWTIMVTNSALHLNPRTHKDPLDFNPWRWKDQDQYSISKNLQPFGGGTRQCAGADYTRVFMAIFLHVLVTKYSWKKVKGGDISRSPVLKFGDGIHVSFSAKA
ncbi:cucurbitadienol 11-hydroxylase-like [Benincasa hispida]|uniref:cucurbitadienol 11-hydroxylase-like n=1 Tax=Benincasa hispida TaxID=102211 RepID=UPI0019022F20|nr:cucurbitadienol 11-hydroxylase-like [Benincasa hispida]